MLKSIIRFSLENKFIVFVSTFTLLLWGLSILPFPWAPDLIPVKRVAVDAIPDLGDNQQIVFTEWAGHSPQDIEDQISYPLTTVLMGIPGVKTVRSNSIFGVSSIYLIFDEEVEFYWSRARVLEKLNALPAGTLPFGVQPALGPDATALGQIFWYTLEGRDEQGLPNGGWDPQELRSIQDFYLKQGIMSAEGVAEVASIGGFVKEYQIELDPVAMRSHAIGIEQVMKAVQNSNLDVGARTLELNRAEYIVRGIGYIKEIEDIETTVVTSENNVPIYIKDVARVQMGPAPRRGGLDKEGSEAVGGVIVARFGTNPLEVINNVKLKIAEVSIGLPSKVLSDGTSSKVTVVPFYDRTQLIYETLGTLSHALTLEILISIIVVIALMVSLRASVLISGLLPLGVLCTFIAMQQMGISANIVALSGIAISIGVMIDVGVIIVENIIKHLNQHEIDAHSKEETLETIVNATMEVSSAVLTALTTTIISFIPVFALEGQEGKLFGPLAVTKTLALVAALLIGLFILPIFAHWLYGTNWSKWQLKKSINIIGAAVGIGMLWMVSWAGMAMLFISLSNLLAPFWSSKFPTYRKLPQVLIVGSVAVYFLTNTWLPIGTGQPWILNLLFVVLILGGVLGTLLLFVQHYAQLLAWCLDNKWTFLSIPGFVLIWGLLAWLGFNTVFQPISYLAKKVNWSINTTAPWKEMSQIFPGLGREFMPSLDEGSFLLMPTNMPHSGVEENLEVIQLLDKNISAIPEVEVTVGKWGRTNSALDPAPISMFENIINYKAEYVLDRNGKKERFKVDEEGNFELSNGSLFIQGETELSNFDTNLLIRDNNGRHFRQWRDKIQDQDDIWQEIVSVSNIPGMTSAPKLQPISTRLVMLSTGLRAPIGIKVYGPDLESIEEAGLALEKALRSVPGILPNSVYADRIVGKPYMEIDVDRQAIARYGLSMKEVQTYLSVGVGGRTQTTTVEGRERYNVALRYARDYRDNPNTIENVLIPTPTGVQIPLKEIAQIRYRRGPQNIKSEDTFLVGYVIFDKESTASEVDIVQKAHEILTSRIAEQSLILPSGTSYKFVGNYENELRATKKLRYIIPLSLLAILMVLYLQFGRLANSLMIFSGIFVAFAGGFVLLWLYDQTWFLNFSIFGQSIRDLFNLGTVNLSVAVWVGFIALFGLATDDGVIMGTYLRQQFKGTHFASQGDIRQTVIAAGLRRIRPAMMTAGTTIIALLPILTSSGKGSDIMLPMAIPMFGGMIFQMMTVFIVPVLFCLSKEIEFKSKKI